MLPKPLRAGSSAGSSNGLELLFMAGAVENSRNKGGGRKEEKKGRD